MKGECGMANARIYTLADALVGKWYNHPMRGDGFIVQADRSSDADKFIDGITLKAFAIRVRPDSNLPDYWQTLYLNCEDY